MAQLEIVDSGVAQMTKWKKSALRREMPQGAANDQDRTVYDPSSGIFAVADGVAGLPWGERAAAGACDAFHHELLTYQHEVKTGQAVLNILKRQLLSAVDGAARDAGGCTTFTGVQITPDNRLTYLHAGDSQLLVRRRDLLYRPTSVQNQEDYLLTNYLGLSQRIVPTALTSRPAMSSMVLTEWGSLGLQAGDRIILASDGVTSGTSAEAITTEWLLARTDRSIGALAAAQALVRESPRLDDATAIVIDIDEMYDPTYNPSLSS